MKKKRSAGDYIIQFDIFAPLGMAGVAMTIICQTE